MRRETLCDFYYLHNLKNLKTSMETSAETCNFTKSSTPPWLFFSFLKLYTRQIAQSMIWLWNMDQSSLRLKIIKHSVIEVPKKLIFKQWSYILLNSLTSSSSSRETWLLNLTFCLVYVCTKCMLTVLNSTIINLKWVANN